MAGTQTAHRPYVDGRLALLVEEVYAVNNDNGWFDASRTWGDGIGLLHSEVSEALEAFRDHGLADATVASGRVGGKPEGVGSELADVLIRALDTCHREAIDPDAVKAAAALPSRVPKTVSIGETFGDAVAYLHARVTFLGVAEPIGRGPQMGRLLLALDEVADKFGVDLQAEYVRKLAFNRTRGYRHGGRTL